MKKRLAIICFTDFSKEPRVLRTIDAFVDSFDITVYSTGSTLGNIRSINVADLSVDHFEKRPDNILLRTAIAAYDKLLLGNRYQSASYFSRQYWKGGRKKIAELIKNDSYHVVIGHGIVTVPILAELSGSACTVFNAHEYYLREFEDDINWAKYIQPYLKYILDNYLDKVHLMFCVSQNIANEYKKDYRIRSVTVTNASEYVAGLRPQPVGDKIRIVHHGAAIRARQLEVMIDCIEQLPAGYELYLMLVPTDETYLKELRQKASDKVRFIDPVDIMQISAFINQFDIGLFILPPVNFNWKNALPNKLFEYVQGRLCIAVSPNTDMKAIVEQYNLGVVSADYTAHTMAEQISTLSREQIMLFKQNSHKAALILNAAQNKKTMLEAVNNLLGVCAA